MVGTNCIPWFRIGAIGGLTNLGFAGAHCHELPCHQGALGDRSGARPELFISEIIPESMPANNAITSCRYLYVLSFEAVSELRISCSVSIVCINMHILERFGRSISLHSPDRIERIEDADRATVTFADHSVREAHLVGAEPDCYLAASPNTLQVMNFKRSIWVLALAVSMLHL